MGISEKRIMEIGEKRIGGTDISAILGINPYRSPIDVYRRIVEDYSPPMNAAMSRGNRLEKFIREEYAENYGTIEPNPGRVNNPKYNFMSASLDDIGTYRETPCVIEYKTAGLRAMHDFGEDGSDAIPAHYRAQCAWYMAACDRPIAVLLALVAGDFKHYVIKRDMAYEDLLLSAGQKFWDQYVKTGTPPPPDDSDGYKQYLESRKWVDTSIQATPEIEEAYDYWMRTKEVLDAAEKNEKKHRNTLLALVGGNESVKGNGWALTYKQQSRSSVDHDALIKHLGVKEELLGEFRKVSTFRVLRNRATK